MAEREQGMTLRHALIIAAGLLICFCPCAMVYNCWSIFVVPVSNELGAASSQFTFFITIVYLVGAIAAPFAGNLLERFDLRVVFSVSVVLVAAGMFACALWQEIWQFYLSGLIEGLGVVTLMFLAVPTLVNRWFAKRTGLFIGLCFAFSGVGGAVWSMVGGVLIAGMTWRAAYAVFAVIMLALTLPATLLFVRSRPSEVGLGLYGAQLGGGCGVLAETGDPSTTLACAHSAQDDEADRGNASSAKGGIGAGIREGGVGATAKDAPISAPERGVPARVMFRHPSFYLLMLAMGVFNSLTVVVNLYASYIYHLGDIGAMTGGAEAAVMAASTVAALLMAVSAASKVLLGALTDKSMVFAVCLACACGAVSIGCMAAAPGAAWLMYVGGPLGGVLYAAIDALSPSITRQLTGPRDYTIIYSRVAMFVNVAGAFAATAFAAVSEISWEAEWALGFALVAAALACGLSAIRLARSLKWE